MSKFDIKIKSVEELLGIVNEESAMDIEICKIRDFKGHPFKVLDDEKMADLVESIKRNGVLSPVLIRQCGNDRYEMVSGHRRMHAAKLAGLEAIPAIIRELSDDEAVIAMVDSNIQREELLPSEKAYAFKMKLEAMKRQGKRNDLVEKTTSTQSGWKCETAELLGNQVGESKNQVRRYIRLTELIPELLDLVDQKRLNFVSGVEISYIDKNIQQWIYEYIRENGSILPKQIEAVRERLKTETINQPQLIMLLQDCIRARDTGRKVTLSEKKIRKYFPDHYTGKQIESVIDLLLTQWAERNNGDE